MPVRLGLGRKPVAASLCRGGASFSKARRQSAVATTKTLMKKYFAYPIVFLFATAMIAMAISESEALVARNRGLERLQRQERGRSKETHLDGCGRGLSGRDLQFPTATRRNVEDDHEIVFARKFQRLNGEQ